MDFDYKNIIEHIYNAYEEAIKSGIKANTIIIDKGVAYINNIFAKPMIFGLDVEYAENLKEDFGANFVIREKENELIKENQALKEENIKLRELIKALNRAFGLDCMFQDDESCEFTLNGDNIYLDYDNNVYVMCNVGDYKMIKDFKNIMEGLENEE